jgi:hypothetical protein
MLLVGAYVIFDILDLDGSERNGWPNDDIIVAITQDAEAERSWRVDLAALGSTALNPPSLSRLFSTSIGKLSPTAANLRVGQSRWLPRVNLHREQARTSSPTTDPA